MMQKSEERVKQIEVKTEKCVQRAYNDLLRNAEKEKGKVGKAFRKPAISAIAQPNRRSRTKISRAWVKALKTESVTSTTEKPVAETRIKLMQKREAKRSHSHYCTYRVSTVLQNSWHISDVPFLAAPLSYLGGPGACPPFPSPDIFIK